MVSNDCAKKCTCQVSGKVLCEKMSCQTSEVCMFKNGAHGCIKQESKAVVTAEAQLVSPAAAAAAAGKLLYDKMAYVCSQSNPFCFRIVVATDGRSSSVSAAALMVHVFFHTTYITVKGNKEAWVRDAR